MFEKRSEPLLAASEFRSRLFRYFAFALLLVIFSLFIGILGYHVFENLSWTDSLLNASMILGGMGPVNALQTESGKIFASFYALYSGIVFLVIAGLIFAPILHRFLHKFHLEEGD
ncbi:MAG TPA: hypothetical protein VLE47_01940 [Candidatus Saccharimonadales bacterium]|nr:hypothetical protein [Candidatus Saccharimonadales bacterium]